jgi:hypothetical protein
MVYRSDTSRNLTASAVIGWRGPSELLISLDMPTKPTEVASGSNGDPTAPEYDFRITPESGAQVGDRGMSVSCQQESHGPQQRQLEAFRQRLRMLRNCLADPIQQIAS